MVTPLSVALSPELPGLSHAVWREIADELRAGAMWAGFDATDVLLREERW